MILLEDMLANIAKSIVDDPSSVQVTKKETESSIILNLQVAPNDMGKVIGKNGKIARAIRSLIKAAAVSLNKKVSVDIGYPSIINKNIKKIH